MKKSNIFYSPYYIKMQKVISEFLNNQPEFLSVHTVGSPRAVGDAIENILVENFDELFADVVAEYSSDFARRAMADFAFSDKDGFYYVVDVKTQRLDTKFNMPNLTSVERLSRFYNKEKNYFVVLKIDYEIEEMTALIKKVTFVPIEFLSWDCLTIGALGWGANSDCKCKECYGKP